VSWTQRLAEILPSDVSPVTATMLAILGLLVVASTVLAVLRRVKPGLELTEVRQRVRSWWLMAAVFLVAVALARGISLAFFAFVSFLAFKEYLSMIPTRRSDRRVLFWAYLAIPVQYWWVGMSWYGMFVVFIPVYMLLFLPLRMVLIGDPRGFLRAVGTLHWGLMTTVFSVSHVAYLLMMPATEGGPGVVAQPAGAIPAPGASLVLFLVILTQLNDVAQFLWGKAIGRRPVVPTLSPNKTYGGLLGGVLTTLALALLLAPWLTPFDRLHAAQAGVIIGLGGFIGDVVISALKRDLGLKDSGSLLPGHGGILDRIDSLTYTAPLFFHFTHYYYY
jgi:phosphatidate cytidylyltransferase